MDGWLKSRFTIPSKQSQCSANILSHTAPQAFGTSAWMRSPSLSAQYSLRGTSAFTCTRLPVSASRFERRMSFFMNSSVGNV